MNYGLPIVDRLQGPLGALLLLGLTVGLLSAAALQGGLGLSPRVGGYVDSPSVEVAAPERAMVAEIGVLDGQHVHAGDVLLRMDTTKLSAQRRLIEMERAQWAAQGRYDRGAPGDRALRADVDLAVVEGRASAARAEQRALSVQRTNVAQLVSEGLESADQLEAIDLRLSVLRAQLSGYEAERRARGAAAAPEGGADDTSDATLAVFDAELAVIDQRIAAATLRAPIDGRVSAVSATVGQWLKSGAPALRVVATESRRVVLCLSEGEDNVREGDLVKVYPRSGGEPIAGAIAAIGSAVESIASAQTSEAGRCALPTPWPSYGRAAFVALDGGVSMLPGQRVLVELGVEPPGAAPAVGLVPEAQAKGGR